MSEGYSFGDIVQIHGDGMAAAEPVAVSVYAPGMGPLAVQSNVVMADEVGAFGDMFLMAPELPGGVYTVVATGQESGAVFTCEFDPWKLDGWALQSGQSPYEIGKTLAFDLVISAPAGSGPTSRHYVVWGDGTQNTDFTVESAGTTTLHHSYANAGTYTATVNLNKSGNAWDTLAVSVTIAKKHITGSFTAQGKAYDGGTAATILTRSLVGAVAGDDVALSGGTATFASKIVGTWTVTGTGFTLSGADAGKYVLDSVSGATAEITAKQLTVDFTAADKPYDGGTAATITGASLAAGGVVGVENVGVSYASATASFSVKDIGHHPVSGSGFTLTGDDKGNYAIGTVSGATAEITAKQLTGQFTTRDKIYDSTNVAEVLERSLDGVVGEDDVSLSGGTATFFSAHIGPWTVTLSGATLDGADKGNYSLAGVGTQTAAITKRDLTVSATGIDKVFNDNADAEVKLSSTDIVEDDDLLLHYTSASFASKHVGNWTVSVTGISITGDDAGNYSLQNLNLAASTTANITAVSTTLSLKVPGAQYSDESLFEATVSPPKVGDTYIDGKVQFYVNNIAKGDPVEVGSSGTATYSYKVTEAAGTHADYVKAQFTADTDDFDDAGPTSKDLSVTQEDARVVSENAPSVPSPGGVAAPVIVSGKITQAADGSDWQGDLGKAKVQIGLAGIGSPSNSKTPLEVEVNDDGTFTCTFGSVNADAYEVQVTVVGNYFTSPTYYDGLAVYDPAAGFATGGGWFDWDGQKTSFGFVSKYGKNGTNAKGSLVVIRHFADGSIDRLKSNALSGLSVSQGVGYGAATLLGKATFNHINNAGVSESSGGNYSFIMKAQDGNNPGTLLDYFGINLRNPAGAQVDEFTMTTPALLPISGGNIVIPHTAK